MTNRVPTPAVAWNVAQNISVHDSEAVSIPNFSGAFSNLFR